MRLASLAFIVFFISSILFAQTPEQQQALDYLNSLRQNAGLIKFTWEKHLALAAKRHCYYQVQRNKVAHNEGFIFSTTGKSPSSRAVAAGYPSRYVLENIAAGQPDFHQAIDGLMSAIYHRFGFLDFTVDQIGFYSYKQVYTFDMGNSALVDLCLKPSPYKPGKYLVVCANKNKAVSEKQYQQALSSIERQNAKIVLYPYDGQQNVPLFFSDETPDPLPKCNVTGFPVSVQFNPYFYKDVEMISFNLYHNGKLLPSIVITSKNDVNKIFTNLQFALFPKHVLVPGQVYNAEFVYRDSSGTHKLAWQFTTIYQQSNFFIINKQTKKIYIHESGTYYFMYFPSNCKERPKKRISSMYSFKKFKAEPINSLMFKAEIECDDGYGSAQVLWGMKKFTIICK